MRKSTTKTRRKKAPKRVLALPDLEQSKAAVLNSLTSASGQRTYDHAIREFVAWYCSEPRLAFNRTVVLRYRIHLEQRHSMPRPQLTCDSPRCAGWPMKRPMPGCSVLNSRPAFGA
jgi:hypothetical protein